MLSRFRWAYAFELQPISKSLHQPTRTITYAYCIYNIVSLEYTLLLVAGLKTFSNWPTYPQLYVNGELLGGLDIVKEMIASNEFKDAMPKQESLDER